MVIGKKYCRPCLSVALVFLLATSSAFGQFQAAVHMGVGAYKLQDLKDLQDEIIDGMPPGASITSSYPSFWYYELQATSPAGSNFELGLRIGYGSTGGRVYYSDYSGELGSDQLVDFVSLSVAMGAYKSFFENRLRLMFDLRPGVAFSNLKVSFYQTIGGSQATDEFEVKSKNLTAEPTMTLTWFAGPVGLNLVAGYHLTVIQGALKTGGGTLAVNGSEAGADWSGWRFGGGISYVFNKKSAKE